MSATIPRFVNIWRMRSKTNFTKSNAGGEGEDNEASPYKYRNPFATRCNFRETVFMNHNHMFNIARHDCICVEPIRKYDNGESMKIIEEKPIFKPQEYKAPPVVKVEPPVIKQNKPKNKKPEREGAKL